VFLEDHERCWIVAAEQRSGGGVVRGIGGHGGEILHGQLPPLPVRRDGADGGLAGTRRFWPQGRKERLFPASSGGGREAVTSVTTGV
jgi:hypothetical protein